MMYMFLEVKYCVDCGPLMQSYVEFAPIFWCNF